MTSQKIKLTNLKLTDCEFLINLETSFNVTLGLLVILFWSDVRFKWCNPDDNLFELRFEYLPENLADLRLFELLTVSSASEQIIVLVLTL